MQMQMNVIPREFLDSMITLFNRFLGVASTLLLILYHKVDYGRDISFGWSGC